MYSLGYFSVTSDLSLFYRYYKAKRHKAGVLIVHGFAEHSGRYGHLVNLLLKEGYSVLSFDLRGHGRSGGKRGFVFSFDEYLHDLKYISKKALDIFHEEKIFVVAHSLGGLIASFLAVYNPHIINGLVLSSPAFGMNMEIPRWKSFASKAMSSFWPTLSFKSTIKGEHLSKNHEVIENYNNDPLIFRHVTSRLYTEVLDRYKNIDSLAHKISIPVFLQVSGYDLVVSSKKTLEIFNKFSSPKRKLQLYDNFLHEIYNEDERDKPIGDLVSWLNWSFQRENNSPD